MEQYVKGFQRFHAVEDVRPITSCKFLLYYYYYYHYYCRCCCWRWWHILLGLLVLQTSISSLLQSATSVITKCDGLLLQSATAFLLQSATIITKCDSTDVEEIKASLWAFAWNVTKHKHANSFLKMSLHLVKRWNYYLDNFQATVIWKISWCKISSSFFFRTTRRTSWRR